jgi:hypothetical protein
VNPQNLTREPHNFIHIIYIHSFFHPIFFFKNLVSAYSFKLWRDSGEKIGKGPQLSADDILVIKYQTVNKWLRWLQKIISAIKIAKQSHGSGKIENLD